MNYLDLMVLENIYLNSISETEDNYFRLTFSRSVRSKAPETLNIGNAVIKDAYSIDIDYTLPIIQMDFECYIG